MTAKQEKELMYNFKLAWATERSRPGKKKTLKAVVSIKQVNM